MELKYLHSLVAVEWELSELGVLDSGVQIQLKSFIRSVS